MRSPGKSTQHTHPKPTTDRLTQYGGAALVVVMIAGAVGQFALALVGLPLLLLGGIVTLVLIAPVMMLTTATPAVSVSADGLTLMPRVWPQRVVAWGEIREVRDYPLLPPENIEPGRKLMVGRRRYRPAEGIMLVIPSLPLYYRFTGLFTGAGFTGVIGLTNRTHTDYDALVRQVQKYTGTE
jgi:hypothetical protein